MATWHELFDGSDADLLEQDMDQEDMNKIMAGERISELERLRDELGTLKWTGIDDGWERAIEAVRKHLEERQIELIHKYMPAAVMADVAGSA